MRELMEISEFVFMFMDLSVDAVIDDVCSVEL